MHNPARALVVQPDASGGITTSIQEVDAQYQGDADTTIDVAFSSLNYKDAMALAGNRGVARILPLVPGIDAVGTVMSTTSAHLQPGQKVLLNGAGLGEMRHGGYITRTTIPAASTVVVPEAFNLWQAAAIGTAGFTAALCVDGLLTQGVLPDDGPILVTGATGGVGSLAVHLLHRLGYRVVAVTGRVQEYGDYLRKLGAVEVLDRASFATQGKPLQRSTYAGVVDTLGSHVLVNAIAQTQWGGTVTACGLAQGADLPGTVLPFILRAVKLVGINSVDAPLPLREKAWRLLAEHLDTQVLEDVTRTVTLEEVAAEGSALLHNQGHGRVVVRINGKG